MKIKLTSLIIISFFIFTPVFSNPIDCNQFKKLSKKYIECETSNKLKIGKKKIKDSNLKNNLDKFKDSKTLLDLIKN